MTYTTPADWSLAELPTHTKFNVELIDNPASLRALNDYKIRVHRTSTVSLADGVRQAISWQAAAYQVGLTWASGTNPSRITVSVSGTYMLAVNIRFASQSTGQRGCGWRKNGITTNYDMQLQTSDNPACVNGLDFLDLVAGEYIEIWAYQSSGVAVNTNGTTQGDCWAALSLWATADANEPIWTPPRTWATGDILSPSMLNTHIRDNVASLRNFKSVGASVWMSEDQSLTAGTRAALTWDQALWNVGDIWDGGSKFVAPVSGIYLVSLDLEWAGSGDANNLGIGYVINDTSTKHDLQFQEGTSSQAVLAGMDLVQLMAGNVFEWYANQNGDDSLSVHGGSTDRTRATVVLAAAPS